MKHTVVSPGDELLPLYETSNATLSTSLSNRAETTASSTTAFHLTSYLLGLLTAITLVGGTLLLLRRADPPPVTLHPPPTLAPTATPLPPPPPAPVVVFVSGAVVRPGVYTLPADARVGDALAAAGGLTLAANSTIVNQAERLWDGAQVHVPTTASMTVVAEEPPVGLSGAEAAAPSGGGGQSGGRINLNSATAAELETLPGIGPSKAAAIIANRPYATVEDLERVPGIGAKTIDQMRDQIVAP
ncbi:MAG: ComEA family DNA-binding protein [Caldilineaceae bacterium]